MWEPTTFKAERYTDGWTLKGAYYAAFLPLAFCAALFVKGWTWFVGLYSTGQNSDDQVQPLKCCFNCYVGRVVCGTCGVCLHNSPRGTLRRNEGPASLENETWLELEERFD